jgi:hypothetical protein
VDDGTGTHTERPGSGRTTHPAIALVRGCPLPSFVVVHLPIALVLLLVVVKVVVMVVAMVVIVVAVVVAVAVVVHLPPSSFLSSFCPCFDSF